jgi:tetratricopeptide (TPR) repeat protein
MAATTEDDLDAGRWTKRAETAAGAVDLTLTLPALLEAADGRRSRRHAPSRPSAFPEELQRRVQRFLEQHEFGSPDEANVALSKAVQGGLFDGDKDRTTGRPLSGVEQAQELASRAHDASGRLRIKLARQALALSADCADAWILLGDAALAPGAAIDHYERAVQAASRTLGHEAFSTLAGVFWSRLETRPYMRARLSLAHALADAGRADEAVDHFREMLRLNPVDNQGVRYLQLPLLLRLGRDAEASELLAAYENDSQATWPYGRALLAFRREGDSGASRQALADAVAANPHLVRFLLDPSAMPSDRPEYFSLGTEDEALYVAEEVRPAVDATPGAAAWMARHGTRRPPSPSRRRRTGTRSS